MSKIVNFYNARPDELKEGDVLVCTITAHIHYDGSISVYRCEYPNAYVSDEGIPQGSKVGDEKTTVDQILPVLAWFKEGE